MKKLFGGHLEFRVRLFNTALIMAALELAVYAGLIVVAYLYPETVTPFQTEEQRMLDVTRGIFTVGFALALTVWFQFRLYNRQQKQLEALNAALDGINKIKTEFLEDIKHEIRTPLTAC